jgi:hypothetical protein
VLSEPLDQSSMQHLTSQLNIFLHGCDIVCNNSLVLYETILNVATFFSTQYIYGKMLNHFEYVYIAKQITTCNKSPLIVAKTQENSTDAIENQKVRNKK